MQPMHGVLALERRQRFQTSATAGGNEEEHAPQLRAHFNNALEQLRCFPDVVLGDGGVNLQSIAHVRDYFSHLDSLVENARKSAKIVVGLGGSTVKGKGQCGTASGAQPFQALTRETRCHRRRQRHVQSEGGGVFGELSEVTAFKRVAAGEHHDGARFVIARNGVQ